MSKVTGDWPRFHCVTVHDFKDRHEYMINQFKEYGLSYVMHYQDKLKDMNPQPIVTGPFAHQLGAGLGIVISHLRTLSDWYHLTDEPYAIFIEDDIDIKNSLIINWNEFEKNLPKDWECVQLIRIEAPLREKEKTTLKLDMRYGRWWGGTSLMKRSWVKKILDRHVISINEFNLDKDGMLPMIENILFYGIGTIYNFPLFIENCRELPGTVRECSYQEYYDQNIFPHSISAHLIEEEWFHHWVCSAPINLEKLLKVSSECIIS